MGFISGSALNVALPALQEALGANAADLLWITNIYLLLLASLILVGGSLGDHYGRKRVFGIGIVLFLIGSAISGFSPTVEFLIVARVIQGLGGAAMIPGSLAIISAYFDDDERGGAIGLWSAFTTLTTVGGPIIGGVLAENGLWRGVFFINIPLGIIALWALIKYVPESYDEDAPRELDIGGTVLATLGLAGITYGFIQAGSNGVNLVNGAALGAGIAAMIMFLITEKRSNHPMMPLSLFSSRVFSGANLLTLFLYAALQGAFFFLSFNLIQIQGYGETLAGFATLPMTILLVLLSQQAGKMADRIGPRIPLTVGPLLTGFGFFMLGIPGVTNGPSDYWVAYFPAIMLIGLGMGITVAPLTTAVMGSVPKHSSGVASGINNAISRTAGVLAIAVMGGIALLSFSEALMANTAELDISDEAREALVAQAPELGNAQVPESVTDEAMQTNVQMAINGAFVSMFRLMTWIGAGLAWISAVFAWFMMGTPPREEREKVKEAIAS